MIVPVYLDKYRIRSKRRAIMSWVIMNNTELEKVKKLDNETKKLVFVVVFMSVFVVLLFACGPLISN